MKKQLLSMAIACFTAMALLLPAMQADAATTAKYAAPATPEQLEQANSHTSLGGISANIIDGALWVWGWNNTGALGLETVGMNETLTTPAKIPPSTFDSAVVKVSTLWAKTLAVTENGSLYGWGRNDSGSLDPNSNDWTILTPRQLSPSLFGDKPVIDVQAEEYGSIVVTVQESETDKAWYLWGTNNAGQCASGTATTAPITTPVKITKDFLVQKGFAGEEIIDIKRTGPTTLFLTKSGNVYVVGGNTYGLLGDNYGRGGDVAVDAVTPAPNYDPALLPKKVELSGRKILEISAASREFAVRDSTGCVWTWGSNNRNTIGNGNDKPDMPLPYLAFGAGSENENTNTKKAVKLYSGMDTFAVLCSDNALFAWGLNEGGRIFSGTDSEGMAWNSLQYYVGTWNGGAVHKWGYPAQTMEDVSKSKTIINVIDDHFSFTVETLTGDTFVAGLNNSGSLGNGTTETTTAPGEPDQMVSDALPPIVPSTKNKISMDIEFYDRTENGALNTISGNKGEPVTANVYAGEKFTVKVYFEDFGKLDSFTLPIRFTSSRAAVVYKSGTGDEEYKEYAGDDNELLDGSNIVKFGASSGIRSGVTQAGWSDGSLTQNDAYPRVNNKKGYLSVHGATTQRNAPVTGRQLMFSVDFIAKGTTGDGPVTFSVMDAADTQLGSDPTTSGGDPLLSREGAGAAWSFLRDLPVGSKEDATPTIAFDKEECSKYFPSVLPETVSLNKIDVKLQFKKDGTLYDMKDTESVSYTENGETKNREYFIVDRDNTDNLYIAKSMADPPNATDQNVTWTLDWDTTEGITNPADLLVSDYLNVIQKGTRSFSFQMAGNPAATETAYFVLKAEKGNYDIPPVYIKVKSMSPPVGVSIVNKDKCPNPFVSNDINSTFTFKALVDDSNHTGNTNVTWTLYNCTDQDDGTTTETVIAGSDLTAPAVITEVGKVTETDGHDQPVTYQTAVVQAQRTTKSGSYVKVKVASTASASVNDTTTFRVELMTTGITMEKEIYLGKGTSRQLSVSPDPFDAFEPKYEFAVAHDTPAVGNGKSYITVDSETGLLSAVNECYSDNPITDGIYDEIIVKETKAYDAYMAGGETDKANAVVARIKVYVLPVNPPPNMDVAAQNNIGTTNDRVVFTADLQPHDSLTIYEKYMDLSSVKATYSDLSQSDINILKETGFVFPDGLDGNGGTIGYLVKRGESSSFTQVPVNYSSEPCRLFGYARLEGKMANSPQNADITVEVTGLRDADGKAVPAKKVSDETGYFEFENYVPVGTYVIKVSRDLYMTRYVTLVVTGTATAADIEVSDSDNPVYLAPGDLNSPKNGKEDPAEYQTYLYNWFGKVRNRASGSRFDEYNFRELSSGDSVIGMQDLNLMLRYYNRNDIYSEWNVTH